MRRSTVPVVVHFKIRWSILQLPLSKEIKDQLNQLLRTKIISACSRYEETNIQTVMSWRLWFSSGQGTRVWYSEWERWGWSFFNDNSFFWFESSAKTWWNFTSLCMSIWKQNRKKTMFPLLTTRIWLLHNSEHYLWEWFLKYYTITEWQYQT